MTELLPRLFKQNKRSRQKKSKGEVLISRGCLRIISKVGIKSLLCKSGVTAGTGDGKGT